MSRHIIEIVSRGVICLLAAVSCFAQGEDPGRTFNREGLNFSAASILHRPAGQAVSEPSYVWSAGMGYGFTSDLAVGVHVLYGDMRIPTGYGRPVQDAVSFGGGGFDARFTFPVGNHWSGYVTAGYDLVTVLNNATEGYGGHGLQAGVGCEYALSRFLGATAGLNYWHLHFDRIYASTPESEVFVPFSNNVVALSFSIRLYAFPSE